MTRSVKKNPFGGFCSGKSDKPGKVCAHRRYRRYANQLSNDVNWDYIGCRKVKENPYDYPKDGKAYWPEKRNDRNWMGK
jgi:hypothetical protein